MSLRVVLFPDCGIQRYSRIIMSFWGFQGSGVCSVTLGAIPPLLRYPASEPLSCVSICTSGTSVDTAARRFLTYNVDCLFGRSLRITSRPNNAERHLFLKIQHCVKDQQPEWLNFFSSMHPSLPTPQVSMVLKPLLQGTKPEPTTYAKYALSLLPSQPLSGF